MVPRGIEVRIPGSYVHEQNPEGVPMNWTLQTSGRTQIIQTGLPETIRMATLTENHGVTGAPKSDGPAVPASLLIGNKKVKIRLPATIWL
jgi:hypothetical protein